MLLQVVRWLEVRYAQGARWDLSGLLMVLPTRRAARRLLELLSEAAAGRMLVPPQLITLGQLPSRLFTPDRPVADDLAGILAWMTALRDAAPALLQVVAPQPPEADDLAGWLALADELARLHEELASEALQFDDVAAKLDAAGDFLESERWSVLAQLQQQYLACLTAAGLDDTYAARREAIRTDACHADAQVVLVGVDDLAGAARQMLLQLEPPPIALIHAPDDEAGHFDPLGAPLVTHWQDRPLPLAHPQLRVVDRPIDQAYEVLRAIGHRDDPAQQASLRGRFAADQITVGLGDESLAPILERVCALADAPAHSAMGRSLGQSRPVMLLRALGSFLQQRRHDDFAALLRHPDIEAYLHRTLGTRHHNGGGDARVAAAITDWITLLDIYAKEHLQGRLMGDWLGEGARAERLAAVYDQVLGLLPADPGGQRPLSGWSGAIAQVLTSVYGHRTLQRHAPHEQPLVAALEAVGDRLREQAGLAQQPALDLEVTAAQALALLVQRLAGDRLPAAPSDGEAGSTIELVGWLEAPLDDAPALIVTGFNEGRIPSSVTADAFLPDHVRSRLGLVDNQRRYVRDRYRLETMLHSRAQVTLIAGRRDAEEMPLSPSRLMLAQSPTQLVEAVRTFYGVGAGGEAAAAPLLLKPGEHSGFFVPAPGPPPRPIAALSVTAFAHYLRCPYRFYLRYVLKLEGLDDRAVEMDGLSFGTLAHDVLETFGKDSLARSTQERDIVAFLCDTLDRLAQQRYGPSRPASVAIQCEQLRSRLAPFARWQAQQAREGWRIITSNVERKAVAVINVDGSPFTITGKIDRIDHHPEHGYRVLDYKSGDTARTPEQTHRTGGDDGPQWVDLQLPLYRLLVRSFGIEEDSVQLGYILLPKKAMPTPLALAPWGEEEIASAHEEALRVIRSIRAGVFWPPTYPPQYEDEFTGICMDTCLERQVVEAP